MSGELSLPAAPAAGAADDPIVDAKTVAALMEALNQAYGWELPVSFPAGTVLAALWALPITVTRPGGGVLYLATATTPYPFAPILPGTVVVQVVDGAGLRGPAVLFPIPPKGA